MDENNGVEAPPAASAPAQAPAPASPTTTNVVDVKRKTVKKKRKTKNDDDFLRLHESSEDDYGAVQLKKKVEVKENNFDDDEDDATVIASDSELDDALNKEEEEMKKEDDDKETKEDSEIQSTKTKTISTRELIVKRKENVEALMRVYEQTYYDLIETMRKRHRKFQLKHGHVGLKSAATALANARGLKAGKDDGENTIVEGEQQQQQQQHEGGDHEREQNGTRTTCSSETCEKNAMSFSRFCFEHVSLDAKQRFYELIDGKLEWRVNEKFMMNAQKPSSTSEDDDNGCGANETPGNGINAKEENDDAVPEPATDPKPLKEMSPGPPGGGANPNASTSPGGADMSLAASLGLL